MRAVGAILKYYFLVWGYVDVNLQESVKFTGGLRASIYDWVHS
jgi:hypothetical protein